MDYQSSTFKPRKGQHVQRAGKKDEASRHQSPASQPLSPIDTRRVNQDLESTGANSRSSVHLMENSTHPLSSPDAGTQKVSTSGTSEWHVNMSKCSHAGDLANQKELNTLLLEETLTELLHSCWCKGDRTSFHSRKNWTFVTTSKHL